jgi:L-amino acid N-acyltransferase YncA
MEIRKQQPEDLEAMLAFYAGVPEDERTFLKEEPMDRAAIEGWLRDERSYRAVAYEDGAVVGVVGVVPLLGLSDHVGEIRLVVAPDQRRSGIGRALARWALVTAIEAGLQKLIVEVVAEQAGAVAMFQALGFRGEALLRDHIRGRDGQTRDLILLAHPVAEQWEAMVSLGIEGELA